MENFAKEEMAGESPASFEIGTDADSEKEKGDIERFQTPEPGKKRLTAAKAAAAALEKDREFKRLARSSGDADFRFGNIRNEFGQQVEWPGEQEATKQFTERTEEERRGRIEFCGE